ncbi:Putative LOC100575238, partial [Caligus rogercresseyi]
PENAQVCSMHFAHDSYQRDLKHELLGLIPRKRLKVDAIPSLLLPTSTSSYLQPNSVDQSNEKTPKIINESTTSQSPGSELQVRLDSHRSRRQMSREANRIVNDLMAKDAEHRTRDVGVQTDHSCFVENIDDLKLKFKKA